jgi:hypothetical protein
MPMTAVSMYIVGQQCTASCILQHTATNAPPMRELAKPNMARRPTNSSLLEVKPSSNTGRLEADFCKRSRWLGSACVCYVYAAAAALKLKEAVPRVGSGVGNCGPPTCSTCFTVFTAFFAGLTTLRAAARATTATRAVRAGRKALVGAAKARVMVMVAAAIVGRLQVNEAARASVCGSCVGSLCTCRTAE